MSLRDQLLKAGLASKKDVRRANQELRSERKHDQGHREKKRDVEAAEAAERAAAEEQALKERAAARHDREAVREEHDREHRIRQIVLKNRLGGKGSVPFFHKTADGRHLHRLDVNDRMAFGLRCGELAVAALPEPDGTSYHVIRLKAADKLAEIAPETVVFRVTDTAGISRPEEQFHERLWDATLRPRRIR